MEGDGYVPECSHHIACKSRLVSIRCQTYGKEMATFQYLGTQHAFGQCFTLLSIASDSQPLAPVSTNVLFATAKGVLAGVDIAKPDP